MKVKISNLLASFVAVFLITFSAQAQENSPILDPQDPSHQNVNPDEDKTSNVDHPIHVTTQKDTTQALPKVLPNLVKPAASKAEASKNSRKEKEEDDDALSFNFLYYMFQKFKMSDLIDQ